MEFYFDISNRLKLVADMVQGRVVADIGTDHGYVPLYLYHQKRIAKGYACDINQGSLQKAIDNVALLGAGDVIETRLGDGLTPMQAGEAETAILSGMGGMLMLHIFEESPLVVERLEEMILSPQRDVDKVRRYLHSVGFRIAEEEMLREDSKVYVVMRCVRGAEQYDKESHYLFGKCLLEKKHPILLEQLLHEKRKRERILGALADSGSQTAEQRKPEMERQLAQIKEALECLQH